MKKVAIEFVAVALCLAVALAYVYQRQVRIPSRGTIKAVNIGVYWDSECTEEVTLIDWGVLYPGETVSKTVYLKNIGNTDVTVTMMVSDWQPEGNYASCSWDAENAFLTPAQVLPATFTLHIFENVTGVTDFSFTITITGVG